MTYFYEINEEYSKNINQYLYENNFNYLLAAISDRVFKLEQNTLLCVTGDTTFYHLDSKETTYILLLAQPYSGRYYDYFGPGHA